MRLVAPAALLLVAGCLASPTPSGGDPHAEHNPQTRRAMDALAAEVSMTFEPAGPHHTLGKAPDGVELDLIGMPVEEVVLSVPAADPEAGLGYLPHVRSMLHGPDRVYDWLAAMLACRSDSDRSCDSRFEQGNLEARFSDGGPDHIVVTIARRP